MTASSSVRRKSGKSRVLDWQEDVARSNTSKPTHQPLSTTQIIVNNITTPNVIISHAAPRSKQENDISTRAIISTLLGVGASAAVAYTMSKDDHDTRHHPGSIRTTFPTDRQAKTAIIVRPPLTDVRNYQPQRTSVSRAEAPRSLHSANDSRLETLASSRHGSRLSSSKTHRSIPPAAQSHTGQTLVRTNNGTKILTRSPHLQSSHASTSRREEYAPSAAYVPLPKSRAATLISRYDTVAPEDSISQVSTVRPPRYRESSPRGLGSKSGSSYKHRSGRADR